MSETLAAHIDKLKAQLLAKDEILSQFPDAQIEVDRWGTERIASPSAAQRCADVDLSHSCGCCSDAALYARPYLTVAGRKVLSSPSNVCVGERSGSGGEIPFEGWEERIRAAGFSEAIREKVAAYFEANPVQPYDDNKDA